VSVPVPYAVSGFAIVATFAFAVTRELLPAQVPTASVAVEQLRAEPPPTSHPVRTIPIVASPVVAPVITPLITPVIIATAPADGSPEGRPRPSQQPRKPRPPRTETADVCARHGGRRVDDAARRSWHCEFKRAAR
jgi:hypothetical protein